jgi:hypothetical protein
VAFSSANASPQYHRLSQLFPLLEGGEFDELVEDVRRHGVREAIWLYEEKILDGRNRQRAAAVAGFPCPTRTYDGDDPLGFVISLNLKRRHLDWLFGEIVGTSLQKMSDGTGEARSRARQHKKSDRRYKMSNPTFLDATKKAIKQRKTNALIHGIYGKDILLPWESRKDFELLLIELQNEFKPDGRMEHDIVFDLAHLRWQKYRLHQMHTAAAYSNPFMADLVNTRKKSCECPGRC